MPIPIDSKPMTLAERINHLFEHHWLAIFNTGWGIFVTLPFVAPLLMAIGWSSPAKGLYFIYNFFCHQLPERSWFLFGPQYSYPKEDIAVAYCTAPTTSTSWFPFGMQFSYTAEQLAEVCQTPMYAISSEIIRRQFIGIPEMGWKVAWSDRMITMYTSIFILGLIYAWLRQRNIRLSGLPWWLFLLFVAPLGLDGTTHLINDVLRLSFRDTNEWAAMLTGHIFSPTFYAGDALGSLNSWFRIVSGLLFGFGVTGFLWPIMDDEFSPSEPHQIYLEPMPEPEAPTRTAEES